MTEYIWLIPLLPLAGSAINGIAGKRYSKTAVSVIACSASGFSFILSLTSFIGLLQLAPDQRHLHFIYFNWITSGDFVAKAEFLFDPLSAVMLLIVTGVGFLIHLYSVGYMQAENGYYRFFAYLNLFLFSMLILVLAGNFLLLFVGWEGVGLCSYLLIGYYFERRSAGDAGKKAFIVNRIGDIGFLLGIFLIFTSFHSIDFSEVFLRVSESTEAGPFITAIGILLFIGAIGKSAQIPLYIWLPDAMEGPTPVSALIHAATMVTAGVYMVVRCSPIFSRSPLALEIIILTGILTALMAATIGLVQTDIKRVLAYSTISQLGYMFVAAGAGAFSAGIFHLMTHAFFKALLFLGAGSVIHAMSGEQNLMRMGGLRKSIPLTYLTMMTGTLAISGIPPFAGFFSKDEILWSAWSAGHWFIWFFGLITAGLTSFYMFRLIFLTFFGNPRYSDEVRHHLHESPRSMTVPLCILGLLSTVGGLIGLPAWIGSNQFFRFLEPSLTFTLKPGMEDVSHSLELGCAFLSVAVALAGMYLAYRMYCKNPKAADALALRWKNIHRILINKYYVDEMYHFLIIKPILRFSTTVLWRKVDEDIIDNSVNGTGEAVRNLASVLKGIQNGLIRSYATWMLLGITALLLYIFYRI
jgi:NADH-quinone oxidoreductase subunit L